MDISSNFYANTTHFIDSSNYNTQFIIHNGGFPLQNLNNSYLSSMISDNPNINHFLFGSHYINNTNVYNSGTNYTGTNYTGTNYSGYTGPYNNQKYIGPSGSNLVSANNNQNYLGPSGLNSVSVSYTGGSGTNYELNGNKLLKISNYFNKKNKIQISNEIANYFELNDTNCLIDDIKNAIEKKSEDNKKKGNSIKSVNFAKKSTIFLDSKGKQLFKLKANYIDINCLIDLIHFSNKRPEYDFFEYAQTPKNIDKLYIKNIDY